MPETGYDSCQIEKVLEERGEVMTSTSGISMYPMLRHRRDMVTIVKVTRPLKRHDVPLYRLKSGKLVLHRILKVTKNGYIIRGDNLYHKERNVTDDMIIGVLKEFYREGKHYDCATSKSYHAYIIYNRLNYPLRWLWKKNLRPFLVKIKHKIIK